MRADRRAVDVPVKSWADLVDALHREPLVIKAAGGHRRSPYIFRGMADATWSLDTSLHRLTSPARVELPLLRSFRKYAAAGTFMRNTDWEVLAVAQHNGLPTRVLDWTAAPLIAVHFATFEQEHFDKDGVVWCIHASIWRDALLPATWRARLRRQLAWVFDVPLLERTWPTLETFDATAARHGDRLLLVEPPSLDARIANQFGIVSIMNGQEARHDSYLRSQTIAHPGLLKRVIIDRNAKREIRDMLDQNNITERMLFPGLPGLSAWLKRYYGPA